MHPTLWQFRERALSGIGDTPIAHFLPLSSSSVLNLKTHEAKTETDMGRETETNIERSATIPCPITLIPPDVMAF